jgi:hypothetical protein
MSEAKFRVSRTNRPRCDEHDRLLQVQTSRGPVAYAYCPVCGKSAKVVRHPVQAKLAVTVTAQR